jgi:hypothetical protein
MLTHLAQAHRIWRDHGSKRGAPPLGTTFTFTLSEPATVTLSFTAAPRRRSKHKPRLLGTVKARGRFGSNKVRFGGKLGKHTLGPGTYRVTVIAKVSGVGSSARTLSFKIVG